MIGSQHSLTGLPGAIAEFLRAMDSERKAIATDAGLSANELRTMAMIAEADGITPKRVADELELTTGAITAITNGLVSRGLVFRAEQVHDRRSLLLQLTDDGHALMEKAYEQFQTALAAASSNLTETDKDSLIHGLTAMTTQLKGDVT